MALVLGSTPTSQPTYLQNRRTRDRLPPVIAHVGYLTVQAPQALPMRQIAVANSEAPGKVDAGICWERPSHMTATPRAPIGT